jgi:hypothetical protein
MGVTLADPKFVTYAFAPSALIAIAIGALPTGIGVPGVSVSRATGVTVFPPQFAT